MLIRRSNEQAETVLRNSRLLSSQAVRSGNDSTLAPPCICSRKSAQYVSTAEGALFSDNFTDPELGWRPYFDEASTVTLLKTRLGSETPCQRKLVRIANSGCVDVQPYEPGTHLFCKVQRIPTAVGSLGITEADAALMRPVAARLAEVTREATADAGAELIDMSEIGADHHVCAATPWVNGAAPQTGAPFHPNYEGALATAEEVARVMQRKGGAAE